MIDKRFLTCLGLLLIATLFVDRNFCSEGSTAVVAVSPQECKVGVGEAFDLDLVVFDVVDLHRWIVTVEWDSSVLSLERYEEGSFLKDCGKTTITHAWRSSGRITELSCTLLENMARANGSGTIVHFIFVAMTAGYASVSITSCTLVNSREEGIQNSVSGGSVEVFEVVHDVAVIDVTPWAEEVYAGGDLNVSVTVKNNGTEIETFDVTVFADLFAVETKTITELAPEDEESLVFTWDTTNVSEDKYTMSAKASIVYGESDSANNVLTGIEVNVVDAVAIFVSPSRVTYAAPACGSSFDLVINLFNVTDLYAYEFSLAWNPSLIDLVKYEIMPIWPEGQYYVALEVVDEEAGMYRVAITAIGNVTGYSTNRIKSIASFTFEVKLDPYYPSVLSSPIQLEAKLSDPYGSKIDCYSWSASYSIYSPRPRLFISPSVVKCRVDDASFTLAIRIMDATYISGFTFRLQYDSTFLEATEAVFADFLKGPYTKVGKIIDDELGYIDLTMEQEYPTNGTGVLAIITFRVKRTIIYHWWPGEFNTLSSSVSLEGTELNTTHPIPRILSQRNAQVYVSSATYTFTPMPGDLDLDGKVDIYDLVMIANYYDCMVGCPYDLNGDGTVDIYDIILVALNYGK